MLNSAALAHAEHADFCVLDCERFISKLCAIDRGTCLWIFVDFDLARLDVHALNDTADFRLVVVYKFSVRFFKTIAELQEVLDRAGCDVSEELEDHFVFVCCV